VKTAAASLALVLALGLVVPAAGGDAPEGPFAALERALAKPPATGLLVTGVGEGSQAAGAGIVPGEVVVSYDGVATTALEILADAKAKAEAAGKETVTMEVAGADGARRKVDLAPGQIGINVVAVKEGVPAPALPDATAVVFDYAALAASPRDTWYLFTLPGQPPTGLEHVRARLEEGRVVIESEVAFDGGEQWGVNHFVVSVVLEATNPPTVRSTRFENPEQGFVGEGRLETSEGGGASWRATIRGARGQAQERVFALPTDAPAVPSYALQVLAALLPRAAGSCFHYRALEDATGVVGLKGCLYAAGVGEWPGAEGRTAKVEQRLFGNAPGMAFFVGTDGEVVRAEFGGPVTTKATKEEALQKTPSGVTLRTN